MSERVWNPTGSTAEYEQWLGYVEAIRPLLAPADLSTTPTLDITKSGAATRAGTRVVGDLHEGDELAWQVRATNAGDTRAKFTVSDDLSDVLEEVKINDGPSGQEVPAQ